MNPIEAALQSNVGFHCLNFQEIKQHVSRLLHGSSKFLLFIYFFFLSWSTRQRLNKAETVRLHQSHVLMQYVILVRVL